MTMTEDRTEYRDSDHYKTTAARVAARPPLPSVEDLAGPIVRGLLALHDFASYEGIPDGMIFAIDQGEFCEEANELLALIEGVATAVETGVDMLIAGETQTIHSANARSIVLALLDNAELRVTMHGAAYQRMIDGTG